MTKWSLKTGGLLIQVVTWTGFTVLFYIYIHTYVQVMHDLISIYQVSMYRPGEIIPSLI